MSRALEWLNRNSVRAYPFKEDAGLVTHSVVDLPLDFVLDLTCYVPFREEGRYRLGQMEVTTAEITVYLLDDADTFLGKAVIDVLNHVPGSEYPITPIASRHISGLLVAGRGVFTVIEKMYAGTHRLTLENGELEPTVMVPVTTEVVTSVGSSELPLTAALVGDVHLQGEPVGRSVVIEVVDKESRVLAPLPTPAGRCIQISAIHRIPAEDCLFLFNGRPLTGIEIAGVGTLGPSRQGGGVTIEARDIFFWRMENGKLVLDSLIDSTDMCARPFDRSLRGPDGGTGAIGPQGLPGEDADCECICPTCETCDVSEAQCFVCDSCEVCDFQEITPLPCDVCDTSDYVVPTPILSATHQSHVKVLDIVQLYINGSPFYGY